LPTHATMPHQARNMRSTCTSSHPWNTPSSVTSPSAPLPSPTACATVTSYSYSSPEPSHWHASVRGGESKLPKALTVTLPSMTLSPTSVTDESGRCVHLIYQYTVPNLPLTHTLASSQQPQAPTAQRFLERRAAGRCDEVEMARHKACRNVAHRKEQANFTTQFTCFTSTKVQILTLNLLRRKQQPTQASAPLRPYTLAGRESRPQQLLP